MGDVRTTIEEQLTAVTELRSTLGALVVAATNADNSITVHVDTNGRVAGLRLSPEAVGRGHELLAEEIMHVMWAGQWQVTAQVEQTVREALSGDPELARTIRRAYDLRDQRPL
ncbi:YbaB/EbfC family nucleoid-associated protein [Phytomonospora sp. NPDC050363]|uniref:YbaB/EbfC family nucleoid-associated protein n=1 Tax=Phytomonospora sp. NPDC050363 TaxID=3155642 RepID=UPI0033E5B2DE